MPHEQQPRRRIEIAPELVAAYAETFIPRFDRYPIQKPDGSYLAVAHPLHLAILEAHLQGHITLGAYALDTKNRAKWLCLDADDQDRWQQLGVLAHTLHTQDIPSYLELSRRGGHLWLFFAAPLPGSDTRRFGKQLLANSHLTDMELYPRQDALCTGPGSLVRLPLGIHRACRRRYHFVHRDGAPLLPTIREQIQHLTDPRRVPLEFVKAILKDAPDANPVFPTQPFKGRRKAVIGDTPSERIKNRISVFDFVRQYVDLDPNGRGYCPFHDDHRMSFGVHQEGNYWHCFAGCGGGSVIDFWTKWRELHGQSHSWADVLSDLLQLLDIPLPR